MNQNQIIEAPGPISIPIDLFHKRTNKTTKLINNASPDFFIDGKHRWFRFEFEKPVYITFINILTEGYDNWNKLSLHYMDIIDDLYDIEIEYKDNTYSHKIASFVKSFQFRPDSKYSFITSQKILNVEVIGCTIDQFHELEDAIINIDDNLSDLEQKHRNFAVTEDTHNQKIEQLKEEIGHLRTKRSQLESDIGKNRAEADILDSKIATLKNTLSDLQENTKDLNASLNSLRGERRELLAENAENRISLDKITREIRLFPSEIAGFVKEGNRNIRNFAIIGSPFMIVIAYVTWSLFSKSVDLTTIYNDKNIDIYAVFLTRLPYVLVSITILQVCGFAVSKLIYEVLQISRQRLNLSKMSIIAKDVSTASSAGLNLTQDQKFERETHLKMELLREHMKQYVGEAYSYQGGRITRLLPDWLRKGKRRDRDSDAETADQLTENQ